MAAVSTVKLRPRSLWLKTQTMAVAGGTANLVDDHESEAV
jgi:hypothetical protein